MIDLIVEMVEMGVRVVLLFLIVLGSSWTCTDARNVAIPHSDVWSEKLCSLCEQFAAQAISYLGENKTQAEIIESLHQACSRLHKFQRECVTLVDYYAPLLFVQVAVVNPEDFCRKVNLCEELAFTSLSRHPNSCELCHHALSEILVKITDPEKQLDIIEALLKACEKVENYVTKCKNLVLEYGPIILANAEQFLETNDLCTSLHICKAARTKEAFLAQL
ncbi:uncharacterized protein [Aristolochia californica]|uniref:uncharacterized protein isoform X2 n=1 Tax=Aristolochia californica TaxID=171875 RepID=UPI0035E1559F